MNIKTALNEKGDTLYLIFDSEDEPFQIELNVDSTRQLIWLLADLVIEAEATQSLYKKEKIVNYN